MGVIVPLQIVREGTKYESYRLSIPRALIHAHDLRDKDFELTVQKGKLILKPVLRERDGPQKRAEKQN